MKTYFYKQKKYKALAVILTFVLAFNMLTINAYASTKWFFEHWHNEKEEWVSGLARGYNEGDYVPHVIDAENFVQTGEPIEVELDYKEYKKGTPIIGYDEATNFFIGPLRNDKVPITSGSAITVGSETPIDEIPVWYLPSNTTFTVSGPVVDTEVKPHVIRYTLTPASGAAGEEFLAELDALGSGPFKGWAMYFEGHLSMTGSQNKVPASADPESGGKTIIKGSSFYPGASLHTNAAAAGKGKMDLQLDAPQRDPVSVLEIEKSTTTNSFEEVGDVINYTITVENPGDTILTEVTVSDPLLGNLTQTVGNDDDGEMSVGEIWIYTGSYTVSQGDVDAGKVDNTATTDSAETEPVTSSVTVLGIKNPKLSIDKSTSTEGFETVGDIINYTITVKNIGNITLTGVTVNDPLLGTLTKTDENDDDGILSVGEIWIYTGSYTVDQDDVDEGQVDNTATADSAQTEPVTDSVMVKGQNYKELTIEKSSDTESFDSEGDIISYTITVKNAGNITLTGVTVNDPLLGELAQTVGNDDDGILSVGEIWTYTGSYSVTEDDIEKEKVDNTATADSAETEPVTDSVTVLGIKDAKLTIEKTTTTEDFDSVGDIINYTITVKNTGNITLTEVTVSDPLLEELTQIEGNDDDGILSVEEIWSYTGSYTVTEEDIEKEKVDNTAIADSSETELVKDSVTVNYDEPNDPPGNPPTDNSRYRLTIEKEADVEEYTEAGDIINYTITLENAGNRALTGVKVTDPMLGSLDGPEGDSDNDNRLDVDETWVYTGEYTVTEEDIENESITNTATADSNETSSVEDSVTVTKTEDEEEIIEEPETPLGGELEVPEEVIEETPVPLALPDTGDFLNDTMLLIAGSLMVTSGLALKKKKKIKE